MEYLRRPNRPPYAIPDLAPEDKGMSVAQLQLKYVDMPMSIALLVSRGWSKDEIEAYRYRNRVNNRKRHRQPATRADDDVVEVSHPEPVAIVPVATVPHLHSVATVPHQRERSPSRSPSPAKQPSQSPSPAKQPSRIQQLEQELAEERARAAQRYQFHEVPALPPAPQPDTGAALQLRQLTALTAALKTQFESAIRRQELLNVLLCGPRDQKVIASYVEILSATDKVPRTAYTTVSEYLACRGGGPGLVTMLDDIVGDRVE